MADKFYITTSIAYTNAGPHIGHTLEFLQADVLARYHRQRGDEVFFLTGTDEHGKKIQEKAKEAGKDTQKFVDEIAEIFKKLDKELGISNNNFIRTTDKEIHLPAVERVWKKLEENKDIYKDKYEALYCVGCERFFNEKDLEDGICPDHKKAPEKISEENYFFKFSKYSKKVKELIEKDEIKIVPQNRKKEVLNMFSENAQDVSFSRPKESVGWGIDVPGDPSQKIYVWADALTNYISGLSGFDSENFKKYWPADVHLIGKDIVRFHAMIWPAILLSLGVSLPKNIYVHGFITAHDGSKMSKSLGNVVDPFLLIKKYGKEAVRYYLLKEIPSGGDGNFSYERFEEVYKSDLQNGIGNLVSRVSNIGEKNKDLLLGIEISEKETSNLNYNNFISNFELHLALEEIKKIAEESDKLVEESKVWELPKKDEDEFKKVINKLSQNIANMACLLVPFIPDTAEKIFDALGVSYKNGKWEKAKIEFKKPEQLFPRIS